MSFIITEDSVTILSEDGLPHIYGRKSSDDSTYKTILKFIKNGDLKGAIEAIDVSKHVVNVSGGKVQIADGVVYYNGQRLHGHMVDVLLNLYNNGFKVDYFFKFIENLMLNPSKKAVDGLYRFLEANNMPLTEDGCFMAYKNVNDNYYDKHSNKVYYGIGSVVTMDRNAVQDDENVTCSYGLHACSLEYLKGGWSTNGHNLLVKINPADVVSVPKDYKNSKLRVCRMEVVKEVDFTSGVKEVYNKPVYRSNERARDRYGRFIKSV